MPGLLSYSEIGPDLAEMVGCVLAASTYAMASLNTGYAVRFMARDSKDIKSVSVNWPTVTAAGIVALRVETIDTSTGKPTGTLYDANANLSQAPVAGWQEFLFSTLPTTGLTAGTEYAIVLLTTTGGTAHTLRAYLNSITYMDRYPLVAMTAADGTTRSNFAEVLSGLPWAIIVRYEDDTYDTLGTVGCINGTAPVISGNIGIGQKFILPASVKCNGVKLFGLAKTGTAPASLRAQLLDSSNSVVASCTADANSIAGGLAANRGWMFPWSPVTLAAGTYRAVMDIPARTGDGSNNYKINRGMYRANTDKPANWYYTSTTDMTAGTISWSDDDTSIANIALMIEDTPSSGGGGGLLAVNLNGGIRG